MSIEGAYQFLDSLPPAAHRRRRLRANLDRLRVPLAAACLLVAVPTLAGLLQPDLDALLSDARLSGEQLQLSLTAFGARPGPQPTPIAVPQTPHRSPDNPTPGEKLPDPADLPVSAPGVATAPSVGRREKAPRIRLVRRRPDPGQHVSLGQTPSDEMAGVQRGQPGDRSATAAYLRQAAELAPMDADAAYNLAVGHDHLGRPALAAAGYRRALQLAQSLPHAFDPVRVSSRLQQLQPEVGHGR